MLFAPCQPLSTMVDGLSLFKLPCCPLYTPTVSFFICRNFREPGRDEVKKPSFGQIKAFSSEYNQFPR